MLKWLWVSGLVIVLDQIAKQVAAANLAYFHPLPVLPFFNLTLLHNTGAAFSFLSDAAGWQRWFFILIAVGVSIGIGLWLQRLKPQQTALAIALACILGGALGNVIDRVVLGYVIDYLDFYYGQWHWPAFNVADIAIFIGAALLVIDSLQESRREKSD